MGMSITHNLGSINTSRFMGQNSLMVDRSLARLSSGYRINSGADGPADLVISEQLRAQTMGLQQAVQNTQQTSNVLGIAEGALSEMNEILKTMRSLALHAANSGITSPRQIAADQAEVDSGLETIDRIASTTRYSSQLLLNGSQELSYQSRMAIDNPMDMGLIDQNLSSITQIFKREGFVLNIGYADSEGHCEARKAFFEASLGADSNTEIDQDGLLTQDQKFTITGNQGSRSYDFSAGSHLGEMVSAIQNTQSITGVDATLIYDTDVESTRADGTIHAGAISISAEAHGTGTLDFYVRDGEGEIVSSGGLTSVSLGGAAPSGGSGSAYGYSFSYSDPSKINTFTVGNSTSSADVIGMQFEGIDASELPGGEIYLYNNAGTLQAFKDAARTTMIGSVALPGVDQKFVMNLNAGGVTGKIYFGYDSVTPGVSPLGVDATRPFASNSRWQSGDTINFGLVTDNESAAFFGLTSMTGITAANLAAKFNITGGDENAALAAITYNIQQALAEWQAAFASAGFAIGINYSAGAAVGNDGAADDPMGATLGLEDTIRIGMAAYEEQSPSTDAGVAAKGGFSGDPQSKYGAIAFDLNDSWSIKDSGGATLNLAAKTSTGGGSGIPFYDVIMHELGHVFGFAHPNDLYGDNGLMSYADSTYTNTPYASGAAMYQAGWTDTFMQDAIDKFYGAGSTTTAVVLDKATFTNGDEIAVTLASGPSNSGFSSFTPAGTLSHEFTVQGPAPLTRVSEETVTVANVNSILAGFNCDGYGRVYLKMTSDTDYQIFKDRERTMLVADGSFGAGNASTAKEQNGSGLTGVIGLTRDPNTLKQGYTATIQLDYMQEDVGNSSGELHGQGIDLSNLEEALEIGGSTTLTLGGSFLSGVRLGDNTAANGDIYVKGEFASNGTDCQLWFYSSASMTEDSLVAESDENLNLTGAATAVRLFETTNSATGASSGLFATLNIGGVTADHSFTATIKSTQLAARLSSSEYGAAERVQLDVAEGKLWSHTTDAEETLLLSGGSGTSSATVYGQDAKITINGKEFSLQGTRGEISTEDFAASLIFNEGDLGSTTIAAAGYSTGAYASRAGQFSYDINALATIVTHATGNTTQRLGEWTGGLQVQLGEGRGDQERSVLSLQAMGLSDLGNMKYDDGTKMLSLRDLLGGGAASLSSSPQLALKIIDKAIDDVSTQRSRLGALQKNLLKTNGNNLSVAIENITRVESDIRDADMAAETTAFTRNQILLSASTAMLAQANTSGLNILKLLKVA